MAAVRDDRRNDLAVIHIARKALGWSDEHYRDVLWTVCRVKSSAELDMAGRLRWIEHLRKCGWTGRGGRTRPAQAAKPISEPLTPRQRLMWSLWQQLVDAGAVENRRMPALVAWAKRQTGVDQLEWLNDAQEALVIESLKRWLVEWHAAHPGRAR